MKTKAMKILPKSAPSVPEKVGDETSETMLRLPKLDVIPFGGE